MVAGKLATKEDGLVLVHGEVLGTEGGTATPGQYHWHAWCERSQQISNPIHPEFTYDLVTCIDRSNGNDVELPAQLFYKAGKVRNTKSYTPERAMVLMVRTGHWGPWND